MAKLLHLVTLVLALACPIAGAQPASPAPLTIAASRSPLSLPLYVAEAEGFFAAAGAPARVVDCAGGHRCLKLLFNGAANVATASDSAVMFQSFERRDFVVVGTVATSANNIKLIGRKDAGIGQPEHLAGKKIGVVRGTASHFFLDAYLVLNGVDPRTLQLVGLQPEELAEALRSGRVDAISVWEPFAYAAVDALKGSAQVLPPASIYRLAFNLIAQRRSVGAPDLDLAPLLVAVGRAEDLIRRHPQRAQAILRARLGVDQRFVDWIWPDLDYRLGLDRSLVKTLESEARWAIREGHVRGHAVPNYLDFIDAAPLTRASPMAAGQVY